jgi:hypothetical protein
MTVAETLKIIYSLVKEMSEQTHTLWHALVIEHISHQMERHLMMVSGKPLVGIVSNSAQVLHLIQLCIRNAT